MQSTRPSAADRYGRPPPAGPPGPPPALLAARRRLVDALPLEVMRVAGVSFDGRQAAIAALRPGQALAAVHEPDNAFDPAAVAVRTLGGAPLGYVPKDLTGRFPLAECFGRVESAGRAGGDAGLWGLKIAVRPGLPPAAVLPVPPNLAGRAALAAALAGAPGWAELAARVAGTPGARCAVTGAAGPGLVAGEVWALDEAPAALRLVGLRPLAPEVHRLEGLLDGRGGGGERQQAPLLQALNGWDAAEAGEYLGAVRRRQALLGGARWRLDVGWLRGQGVQVPAGLED